MDEKGSVPSWGALLHVPASSRPRAPGRCFAKSTELCVRLRNPAFPRDKESRQDPRVPQDVEGEDLFCAAGTSAALQSAPGLFVSLLAPPRAEHPSALPCLAGRDELSRAGDFRRGIEGQHEQPPPHTSPATVGRGSPALLLCSVLSWAVPPALVAHEAEQGLGREAEEGAWLSVIKSVASGRG